MIAHQTLYQYDTKRKVRVWYVQQNENQYQTVAGLKDGKLVESGWTICSPKNVGKKNESTAVEQCSLEVEALYKKKRKQGWNEILQEDAAYFEPMLASKFEGEVSFPLFSQPKLDGIRCVATKDGLFSRAGERFVSCPHIETSLWDVFLKNPSLVIDGELYNHDLKHDFNQITSIIKRNKNLTADDLNRSAKMIKLYTYDCYHDNTEPFSTRLERLHKLVSGLPSIEIVQTFAVEDEDHIHRLFDMYRNDGYEGQMLRYDRPYEVGKRSKSLMKHKSFMDGEYIVVEIVEGKGNWGGKAKSVVMRDDKGNKFSAGMKGNEEYLAQVLIDKHKYVGTLAKIKYQNLTPKGVPRMGIVHELDRQF